MTESNDLRAARRQIAADIPSDLAEADDLLMRFGRWAMDRQRFHHCGSAEGHYRAPPGDADREPREVLLPTADVVIVNRALLGVPDRERIILHVLYVPKRQSAQAQLRLMRVPPTLARDRHLRGLRFFWNGYRIQVANDPDARMRQARRAELVRSAFERLVTGELAI